MGYIGPGLLKVITKIHHITICLPKYESTYVLFEVKAVSQHLRDEINLNRVIRNCYILRKYNLEISVKS